MLQFTYKLKITERIKAKCSRNPRYNPEKDGPRRYDAPARPAFLYMTSIRPASALDDAQREFIRIAGRGLARANYVATGEEVKSLSKVKATCLGMY